MQRTTGFYYLGRGGLDQWPSLGVKYLALVLACPPRPLTLLDLIPHCLGKPGSQRRCECEKA